MSVGLPTQAPIPDWSPTDEAQRHGGRVTLTKLEGQPLVLEPQGDRWRVIDAQGNTASIVVADAYAANAVIFTVDRVLRPRELRPEGDAPGPTPVP